MLNWYKCLPMMPVGCHLSLQAGTNSLLVKNTVRPGRLANNYTLAKLRDDLSYLTDNFAMTFKEDVSGDFVFEGLSGHFSGILEYMLALKISTVHSTLDRQIKFAGHTSSLMSQARFDYEDFISSLESECTMRKHEIFSNSSTTSSNEIEFSNSSSCNQVSYIHGDYSITIAVNTIKLTQSSEQRTFSISVIPVKAKLETPSQEFEDVLKSFKATESIIITNNCEGAFNSHINALLDYIGIAPNYVVVTNREMVGVENQLVVSDEELQDAEKFQDVVARVDSLMMSVVCFVEDLFIPLSVVLSKGRKLIFVVNRDTQYELLETASTLKPLLYRLKAVVLMSTHDFVLGKANPVPIIITPEEITHLSRGEINEIIIKNSPNLLASNMHKEKVDYVFGIVRYLVTTYETRVSEIFVTPGSKIRYRLNGEVCEVDDEKAPVMTPHYIAAILPEICGASDIARLYERGDASIPYELHGVCRLRITFASERNSFGLSMRPFPKDIPTFEFTKYPEKLYEEIRKHKSGLVMICGGTGSGKSTTQASIIGRIAEERKANIITLEDPVEYLYNHSLSLIHQREKGVDFESWSDAINTSLRSNPDIIVVQEMIDAKTIQQVFRAAQTGHLVFTTAHAGTLEELFQTLQAKGDETFKVLPALSSTLKVVSVQMLENDETGKPGVIYEHAIITKSVGDAMSSDQPGQVMARIRDGEFRGESNLFKASSARRMRTGGERSGQ